MIDTPFSAPGALAAFGLSILIFGLAPGLILALIVKLIPDEDRRRELQAELYEVPRWERPYWVAQQLEVALRLGASPRIGWWWGKHVWHRAKIESGIERNRQSPETFWVPDGQEKAQVGPGDIVKLMWHVPRMDLSGERMWVRVTHRRGDRLIGRLDNYPVCAFLNYDDVVKFHIDDIIDISAPEEARPEAA
ncbi:hypothetical protein OVA21_19170 [Dietzia sp. SL131]|uniref:hypothetical protein n=1 Tax=Dietzia sp. SL131 TaxID=2995149 RepID=UPI00227CB874|nr:hypothetical protein [Dietzia sp. SL131]MCY1659276.1 hypothetical protein [Dietzia sp. SL131]